MEKKRVSWCSKCGLGRKFLLVFRCVSRSICNNICMMFIKYKMTMKINYITFVTGILLLIDDCYLK